MVDQSSTQYALKLVRLSADRDFPNSELLTTGGNYIDLQKMTMEVNLFEALDKSYVTAKIVIMDDIGWNPLNVNLRGTERVELLITGSQTDELSKEEINIKDLRVVSIVRENKSNDKTAVYAINCMSDYAYEDAAVKISKSYRGQGEDIAEKILEDYLDVGVLKNPRTIQVGEKSAQGSMKVVIPYISPLESLDWLTERLTTIHGLPWFAYATIWDQKENSSNRGTIRYGTLDTLLTQGLISSKTDNARLFIHSQKGLHPAESFKARRREIGSFTISNRDNTFNMINQGTVGSRLTSLDAYTTRKDTPHFELGKFLEKKVKPFLVGEEYPDIYDAEDKIEIEGQKKSADEYDARYNNTITSYGTYEWDRGYHDIQDTSDLLAKWSKAASLSVLNKNILDVTLSGYNFLTEKLTVGDVVRLSFQRQVVEEDNTEGLDERLSGHYMILNLRHVFAREEYRVAASMSKVAKLESLQ